MFRITVAIVDVVESSGPSRRSIRHQAIENRHADKRPAALSRVGSGLFLSVQGRPVSGSTVDLGVAMVAHRAPPHGPTFTPGAILRQPSADADPAQKSAQSVTAAAAQSLGGVIVVILSALSAIGAASFIRR
jgi:hypothetical protein